MRNLFSFFLNKKSDLIPSYFYNKTVLVTNCYHPVAREIIYYLSNNLNKNIRFVLIGKHPAFVSYIEKKIIDRNDYKIERKKYVLSFSIDSRNYFHIKKAFKIIKSEWDKIDFIFHFDDYYFHKSILDLPVHNFKYLQQWNQLSFFNIIKAHQIFIQNPIRILTIQNNNKQTLYYHFRKSFIDFLKENQYSVSTLILNDNIINISSQKPKKRFLKQKIIDKSQVENIINQFIKEKSTITIN
ncbi:MAG: hypothetical protein KatS3mg129_2823 [Leptospiraceae bacterium]|nr:MAG: hypothetical protein KatS3mg129_2823 [Leptospiraceae bacterium]